MRQLPEQVTVGIATLYTSSAPDSIGGVTESKAAQLEMIQPCLRSLRTGSAQILHDQLRALHRCPDKLTLDDPADVQVRRPAVAHPPVAAVVVVEHPHDPDLFPGLPLDGSANCFGQILNCIRPNNRGALQLHLVTHGV